MLSNRDQGSGIRDQQKQRDGCRIVYVSPLKALAVDVERNLRSPLAGMANIARRRGVEFREPTISVRTGDTPQRERAKFARHPAEILITTPESLYLLLTSQASEALRTVDTVIIDEIHALVPTKRGAHLALSLERLEALTKRRLQRIGLSATQRPLEEVARFLGGVESPDPAQAPKATQAPDALYRGTTSIVPHSPRKEAGALAAEESSSPDPQSAWSSDASDPAPLRYRPVTIVNASARKQLKLHRGPRRRHGPPGRAGVSPQRPRIPGPQARLHLECDSSPPA
jgi:ATP-dependent Lhr-like helicase